MKNAIKFLGVLLIVVTTACSNEPVLEPSVMDKNSTDLLRKTHHSTADIINPIYNTVPGTSTLHRTPNGITVNYRTTGLKPGYVYTLGIAIFNNPEECTQELGLGRCDVFDFFNPATGADYIFGGGHLVGESGIGNFSVHLNVDDNSESIMELFGLESAGGLNSGKVFSSQIDLVLRNHGPAQPGLIDEQLSSFNGGCTVELGFLEQDADEVGECSEIEFAIHLPVE